MSEGKTEPAQAAFETAQLRMSANNRLDWDDIHEKTRDYWRAEARAAIATYLENVGSPAAEDFDHAAEIVKLHGDQDEAPDIDLGALLAEAVAELRDSSLASQNKLADSLSQRAGLEGL
jgi:hypothetical protein